MKKWICFGIMIAAVQQIAFAQTEGGKVLIQTEYDDPMRNKWNVGVYAGLEVQSKASGGLFYGASARYTLPKLATFSANMSLDLTKQTKSGGLVSYDAEFLEKLPAYSSFEVRGVFHFRDAENMKSHNVKLGSDGQYEYSTNYEIKARSVQGITASLNFNSRMYVQNRDSIQILEVSDAAGNNPGYLNGLSTGQNNMFLGIGLHAGEYTFYKGKFTGGAHGSTKTRRIKRMMNANIEFLFAPAIAVKNEAYFRQTSSDSIQSFVVNDAKKKRMGFRITADVLNGKPGWYMRMEFGVKPGIEAPLKSESKMAQRLTNGYALFAFGIGL